MDELENLVVSGVEMDRKIVAEILAPYVRLERETCGVRPNEKWDGLTNEEKIMVYLLARKAMVALGFPVENEEAVASEVIKKTGIRAGSGYPALRSLLQQRLIEQVGKRGGYLVPNYALESVKAALRKREDEQ